jgi:hypothetical protein
MLFNPKKSRKKVNSERLITDHIFTTSSKDYFHKNGLQLAMSLKQNSGETLTVYSEDNLSEYSDVINYIPLNQTQDLFDFRKSFRSSYGTKYHLLHYSLKMDIWAFKIFAQKQFLEENPGTFSLFLDSDSVVLNSGFTQKLNQFVSPARNFDCGLFRRSENFLHPETGFLTFCNSPNLEKSYIRMTDSILSGDFRSLPSWTDSSLVDREIIEGRISALDFCLYYNLSTDNPVYESKLRESFLHLKGNRKGMYSAVKRILGKYR